MTLAEIESLLPSGFHDSHLRRVAIDYEQSGVLLDISLSVGDPDGPSEQRDNYREASIRISELVFLSIQPPDSKYAFDSKKELWIVDGYDTRSTPQVLELVDADLVKRIPQDAFLYSFFVSDWNSFIHVAARSAELTWKNSETIKK